MGVVIGVQATIKPNDGSKQYTVDISGFNIIKWEHPLAALFFGDPLEEFAFIQDIWETIIATESKDTFALNIEGEDEPVSYSNDISCKQLVPLLQKLGYKLNSIIEGFDSDFDKVVFVSSLSQLLLLAELEAKRDSKIEIMFYPG